MPALSRLAPGLALAVLVAALARLAAPLLPSAVGEVLVAVLLGIVLANVVPLPPLVAPGVSFAVQRLLRAGIVLLGARLDLLAIAVIGGSALGLVVAVMAIAFAAALLIGRAVGVPPRLALLIGVGTAVCGNSAIVATAPVVRAQEREVSFAVATITLFGTLAVFVFPLLGHLIGMHAVDFGLWAGIAVNDTSQVLAASAAYSETSLDVATVVKLVRNALMAPLIVLIAWWWYRREAAADGATVRRGLRSAVPLFVLGFLAMAALGTSGAIPSEATGALGEASRALILVALAGVGLNTRLAEMRRMGLTPFYVGLGTATVLAVLSLVAVLALEMRP